MSPKNTSLKLLACSLERKKKMNKNIKKMNNKRNNRLKGSKLYLSYLERQSRDRVPYVVRSIKINHLLGPPPAAPLRPKKVGFKAGDEHLPSGIGCGVFGSSIVFAAGFTPATVHTTPSSTFKRDVYAFETESNKFIKMDAKLVNGQIFPKMVELDGKLCALSSQSISVFDPEINAWCELPKPPFWNHCPTSCLFSYAITGTKMSVSYGSSPIYCFDIAQDNRNCWRRVDSMRDPFNFDNKALVLDLPGHPNKKLMFGCS